jgi:hypothetical protein
MPVAMSSSNSIATPVALEVRPFNQKDIYVAHVHGRRVVYLDTNFWIQMTEVKRPAAAECLAACRASVQSGAVIFPLSFASITELVEQPPAAPREAQARLMDELSTGISFRASNAIHKVEAQAAYEFFTAGTKQPPDKSLAFTCVNEYIGDAVLTFPAGSTLEFIESSLIRFRAEPALNSVLTILKAFAPDDVKVHREKLNTEFVEEMTDNAKSVVAGMRAQNVFDSQRARHEERLSLFKSTICPLLIQLLVQQYPVDTIRDTLPKILADFNERHGPGGRQRLVELCSLMPSLEIFAQMMAARTMNSEHKVVQAQDFWDVEHARNAAYSDAFATCDRGLIDLLDSRCNVPKERGCLIVRSLDQLAALLRGWTGAAPVL